MLPTKNINALKVIYQLFLENHISWKLTGSTNLALQGVSVEAKDVDIFINKSEVEKVQKLLAAYVTESLKFSETSKFRSYFGRYSIEDCVVEIMCDLEIFKENIWLKTPASKDLGTSIKLEDIMIPCVTLKSEYEGCIILDRLEKAEKIKSVLQTS